MVQHFMSEEITPLFYSQTQPQLFYMGKILPELSTYPRILHSHSNHVEISIIYSGTSEYLVRERMQLIQPGDVIIYNSGVVHDELSNESSQIGSYFFAIGNLLLPNLRANALIADNANPVVHIRENFDRIIALCEAMLQSISDPCEWSKCIEYYSMCALLEIVWRAIHANTATGNAYQNFYLGRKIKDYIDAHFCEQLNMDKICGQLGLSKSYVSHTFKDLLGYSPMQYVMRRKIGEAQTLLISTNFSITQIAQMVGFDVQSHFNQRFIKYVGISPGKFRKNYRNQ